MVSSIYKSWGIAQVWNRSLENGEERKYAPRRNIWASEIGGSFIDRYLKMKGVEPTNPPNARSRRKFEAGNIWEAIVGYVLNRAGILIKAQERLEFRYDGLLPVSGKLDFLAGGHPDYNKAMHVTETEFSWLPPFITKATMNIIQELKERYPDGLKEIVLEIKSCSANMYEVYESKNMASPQHRCQNFHYLKAKEMNEGHIIYICRDDARIIEIPVFNPSTVEDRYKSDIKAMTGYIENDETPPIEKPITFDEETARFSANWKVGYSNYLTMLYNFKNQMEFDSTYRPIAERFNRVLGRIRDKKEMTKNNMEALSEMKKMGFESERIKNQIENEVNK